MRLEKARWYNDAQCAAVLTIDDLSYGYLDPTGRGVQPFTDWGYACQRENSIFHYFETQFLQRFPEVRYTVFVPCGAHSVLLADGGYPHHAGDAFENPEYGALLQHIAATGNEVAYHGHHHGVRAPSLEPQSWLDEDREYTLEQYRDLVAADVARLEREYGIRLHGGRSPGYHNGPGILAAATSGLFQWWSFDYTPYACHYAYRGVVFALPTNVGGQVLRRPAGVWRGLLEMWHAEQRIGRLIAQGALINVTEHFMQARSDGKRQTPSVFDDLDSLHRIFGFLKGVDTWYATCTGIARYRTAYDHTRLNAWGDGTYELLSQRTGDDQQLSLVGDVARLQAVTSGTILQGRRKRGRWVFPNVPPGVYRGL